MQDRAHWLLRHLLIDPESDRLLHGLTQALLAPADRLSLVAHGNGSLAAWDALTDPAVAPGWALPHAAQYTGGTMPARFAGESDEDYTERARREVVRPRGMLRGSPQALLDIAQPYLTDIGRRSIRVAQRVNDDPDLAVILVRAGGVTDEPGLVAALNHPEVVTAGMEIQVQFSDAPLIDEWARTIDATPATPDTATVADFT